MLTLLVGGARSGKSALALDLAQRSGVAVTFVATAEALDAELAERIEQHRAERPVDWSTIEEPTELERVLESVDDGDCVVVDCLTIWISNLVGKGLDDAAILGRGADLAARTYDRPGPVIVVSNEVGSGIVPIDALSRRYRDLLGRVNALFAARAGRALLVVAGRTVVLENVRADTTAAPMERR